MFQCENNGGSGILYPEPDGCRSYEYCLCISPVPGKGNTARRTCYRVSPRRESKSQLEDQDQHELSGLMALESILGGETKAGPAKGARILVTILILVQTVEGKCSYYEAKPANYEDEILYDIFNHSPPRTEPLEESFHQEYPRIKYKAQAKHTTDADYNIVEPTEPERSRRSKMGRTKLIPPSKRPAVFNVKPALLSHHDSAEPLDDEEVFGPGRRRLERWETKKSQPEQKSDKVADYDYTAAKLQGKSSDELVYDSSKDEYSDDDEESDIPNEKYLQFLLRPNLKRRPTTLDQYPVNGSTVLAVDTKTHKPTTTIAAIRTSTETQNTDSVEVIPLYLSQEVTENQEYSEIPIEPISNTKHSTYSPLPPAKHTKPPVFARIHVPTMILPNEKHTDAVMVSGKQDFDPDIEKARIKIRNRLLSEGIDPISNPDDMICEYVVLSKAAIASGPAVLTCIFITLVYSRVF